MYYLFYVSRLLDTVVYLLYFPTKNLVLLINAHHLKIKLTSYLKITLSYHFYFVRILKMHRISLCVIEESQDLLWQIIQSGHRSVSSNSPTSSRLLLPGWFSFYWDDPLWGSNSNGNRALNLSHLLVVHMG